MPPAARRTDPVEHGLGMLGMVAGMLLGAALVAIFAAGTVASGGLLAAAVVGGAVAAGGLAGEKIAQGVSSIMHLSGLVTGNLLMPMSQDVFVGYLPSARAKIDGGPCNGLFSVNHFPMPLALIAQGSDSVDINNLPAARVGDKLVCGADIQKGEDTVIIGGGTKTVLPIFDMETIMHNVLVGVGLICAVVGLGALVVGVVTGAVCLSSAIGALAFAGLTMVASQEAHKLGDMIGPGWGDVFEGVTDFAGLAIGLRALSGEPVDVVTGEVCAKALDFQLPGSLPLRLERAYASSLNQESWLGPNWCLSWGQSVIDTGVGIVHYIPGDGRKIPFDIAKTPGSDGWARNPTVDRVRLRATAAGFEVRNEQRHILRFDYARGNEWLLTSIEDENGNAIHLRYEDGALRAVAHTGGYRLRVDGTRSRITSIALEQPDGTLSVVVRYEYDSVGRLSGVDNGSGQMMRYQYDDESRMTRWSDRVSTWYEYNYDQFGRCVEAAGPEGMYHYNFIYDPPNRTTTAIDSYGAVTLFRYNKQNRVVEQQDPLGGVTLTEWDERGNKLSVTDPENRRVQYEYDGDGNLLSTTGSLGAVTRVDYNELNLPVSLTDAAGIRWVRKYDGRGNLIEAGLEGAPPWRYERDASGNAVRIIDPSTRSRRITYNAAGLPVSVSDWEGNVTRYARDAFGRVTSEVDPLDSVTGFEYDRLNKLSKVSLPSGGEVRWDYDDEGNITRREAPDGTSHSYEYGAFDLLKSVTRPSGATVRFRHDDEARLVSVQNDRSEKWNYEYDLTGRVVSELDFSGRLLRFEYDKSGLLARRVNAKGESTAYQRDKGGRLVRREASDGRAASYEYDANNRLLSAANESIEVRFERDEYGRVLREWQGDHLVESSYDERGLRTSRRTSSGERIDWSYDGNGRVSKVGLPGDEWLEFARDAAGRDVERRMRGGFVLRQDYDPGDRLVSQWAGFEAGASRAVTAIADRQYRYDANDNPTEIQDSHWGGSQYSYDRDGRIAGVVNDDGSSEHFGYDHSGNIVESSTTGRTKGRAPDRPPGLAPARTNVRVIGRGGRFERDEVTGYFYDEDGRVIEKHEGQNVWRYEWTAESLLRSVTTPSGDVWTYDYDAFGRRVRKTGPDSTTDYVWDGKVIAEEIRRTRSSLATSTWVFADSSFRPVAKVEAGKSYACVTDQVGSPRELISADGKLSWSAHLSVWGEVEEQGADKTDCPIRFQGQYADDETGLHYNFSRYYDPSTGQYLSADPIGLEGGSREYGYVENPLAWIDPLGLASCAERAAAKGYPGVETTPNGGPTFKNSDYLYPVKEGEQNIVKVKLTGSRRADFAAANEAGNITVPKGAEAPEGYVWHHVDDFNPATGESSMELVQQGAHRATYPHSGSVSQWEKFTGKDYKR